VGAACLPPLTQQDRRAGQVPASSCSGKCHADCSGNPWVGHTCWAPLDMLLPGCAAGLFKPSAALPDASMVQGQLQAAKSEIDKLAALVAADAYGTRDGSFSGAGSPFGNDLIKSASVAEVEASQDLVSTQNALRCAQGPTSTAVLCCYTHRHAAAINRARIV
jgi:hypothetical protein